MELTVDFSSNKITKLSEFFNLIKDERVKFALMQSAVDQYRELRDEKSNLLDLIDSHEVEKKETESKIDSVKDLTVVVQRIDNELSKFNDLISDSTLEDRIQSLKEDRLSRLMKLLVSFSSRFLGNGSNQVGSTSSLDDSLIRGWFMVVSSVTILIGGVVLYVSTQNVGVLLAGTVTAVLQIALFLLFNVFSDVILSHDRLFSTQYTDGGSKIFEKYGGKFDSEENMLFVRSAWLGALKQEKERLMSIINSRVDGGDIGQLTSSISGQESKSKEAQARINEIADIMMNAQDYLALRRELDLETINGSDGNENKPEGPVELTFKNLSSLDESPRQSIMKYIEFLKQTGKFTVNVS
jgi:hypothetical protein